jgi:superfamily II DNA/RNA helicase
MGQQRELLAQPLDLLVGTPQKLAQHAEKGHLAWGDVEYLVLDEADTMFDKGFGPEVRAVLRPLRSKQRPARVVLVVATLTKVIVIGTLCLRDAVAPIRSRRRSCS